MFKKIVYDVILSQTENCRGEYMLAVRASQKNRYMDIPTNIYVSKNMFKDGLVTKEHPQCDGLNAMLRNILNDIQATEIEAYKKDIDITVQKVYSIYVEHLSTSIPLGEFTEQVLEFCSNRREVTKNKYRNCVNNLNKFQKDVKLDDIDLQFLKRYERYRFKEGCSDSTVWSDMKIIRTLFNEAIKRDLLKPWQTPFRNYEIPEIRSRVDVLRWQEIITMHNYKFEDRRWNRIRDIFCFLCYTGMRIGDFLKLTDENIKRVGEEVWLNFRTSKTNALVQIPLHLIFYGNALDIMSRYKTLSDLCRYKDCSGINRAISNMVKIVNVGGSQRISCHTARRSCITALADFGVNVYTIQKIVGHARITTTQKYMQLSTATLVNDLKNAFSKGESGVIKKEPIYKCKTGHKFTEDSPEISCKNCIFVNVLTQGKKHPSPHHICSRTKQKTRANDYCSRFKMHESKRITKSVNKIFKEK